MSKENEFDSKTYWRNMGAVAKEISKFIKREKKRKQSLVFGTDAWRNEISSIVQKNSIFRVNCDDFFYEKNLGEYATNIAEQISLEIRNAKADKKFLGVYRVCHKWTKVFRETYLYTCFHENEEPKRKPEEEIETMKFVVDHFLRRFERKRKKK
ncbi:MAG: hypothetical protein K6G36_03420 [Candidatus Saccharibacteria bacterium]|nr:hypothetical protein [Candidatus Saccharibacteria bacterium]